MIKNRMRPIHPGEILREEFLLPMDISVNALAIALHVSTPRMNDIVRERRAITADTALRLARYFGTSVEFWLGLQADYDAAVAAPAIKETLKDIRPYRKPSHPAA